ncbi:hypothetical protein MTO96_004885 [Rhipicephalus appendiculatus]
MRSECSETTEENALTISAARSPKPRKRCGQGQLSPPEQSPLPKCPMSKRAPTKRPVTLSVLRYRHETTRSTERRRKRPRNLGQARPLTTPVDKRTRHSAGRYASSETTGNNVS